MIISFIIIMIKANNKYSSISQSARLPSNAYNPEATKAPCDWLSVRRDEGGNVAVCALLISGARPFPVS